MYVASVPLCATYTAGMAVIKYQYGYSCVLGYGNESYLRFCIFSCLLAVLLNHPHGYRYMFSVQWFVA